MGQVWLELLYVSNTPLNKNETKEQKQPLNGLYNQQHYCSTKEKINEKTEQTWK
jgi:hypothetical protein